MLQLYYMITSGNRYMLYNTIFKYNGKDIPTVKSAPQFASQLGYNKTIISPAVELSNYDTGFHFYNSDVAITNPNQIWNSKTNTLSYNTPNYSGSWRFDGENMTLALKSPKLSYDLNMQGGKQVMWTKDTNYQERRISPARTCWKCKLLLFASTSFYLR